MIVRKAVFIIIIVLFLTVGGFSFIAEKLPPFVGDVTSGITRSLYAEPNLTPNDTTGTPLYGFRVVNTYPHDPEAFTQGLIFHKGHLYEGTGLHGHSTLRKVELKTGRILQTHSLPAEYFGEGITICRNRLIQLTWQSQTGFIYDPQSFRLLGTFSYQTEGWGITCDGNSLIMSDGTATLRFLDPRTFKVVKQIEVRDHGKAVPHINELEYIKGEIYANIWDTAYIARISPRTGQVLGWIDLRGLYQFVRKGDVLNGIAYDAKNDRLYVTGKYWPKLFEIRVEALK
jgi:glutaminyl-peptide cyclotransferase